MKHLYEIASECRLLDFNQLLDARFIAPHSTVADIETCSVLLVLSTERGERRLTIACGGVERFTLSRAGGGITQVLGLAFEDCRDRQMGRISWRVYDSEEGRIEVLCREARARLDAGWYTPGDGPASTAGELG
jgi:hypothetical protein